ncbi:hypothetical protein HY604_00420 [Candidatus Peregrinibacteria bacterium]|nr:hypothetical protein [Candidatus Peregrinibacteria bacterium]
MKLFYLTASIIFSVLILILSFENISAQCSGMMFFFYDITSNPTLLTLGIAIIGILTGAFYHAFITRVMATSSDEEDEQF